MLGLFAVADGPTELTTLSPVIIRLAGITDDETIERYIRTMDGYILNAWNCLLREVLTSFSARGQVSWTNYYTITKKKQFDC